MALAALSTQTDEHALNDLAARGYHLFSDPLDAMAAAELLSAVRGERTFDASLFLAEAEFDADPVYVGVNPRPGRNLLEAHQNRLAFVEQAPALTAAFTALLGEDYVILNKKLVCGVPASAVPDWLKRRIEGDPVNNLGAYVRPQYRDVTYFYGIDFHQDLIDFKDRDADFLTLYIYLHRVTRSDAPLFLLEASHKFGATVFPHELSRGGGEGWIYGDGRGREMAVRQVVLTGEAGFAAIWHPCTLHGTQPDAADHERISLRYLVAKGSAAAAGIDLVNARLDGPIRLSDTRLDLRADGSAQIKQNAVAAGHLGK
jgi:hypothetical protein